MYQTERPLLTFLVLAAIGVASATASGGQALADPAIGRTLASQCAQCHGTNGRGPGFDRLAGKSANELYSELKEFQSGKEGNGIMAKHAMGYTDAQIRALADWLSKQR